MSELREVHDTEANLDSAPRPAKVIGKRERNKRDKKRRIRESAKTLFEEKGYQEATVRDIAERAGVALGTLFLYARDKRDLLFLIFQDELDEVTDQAFDGPADAETFVDRLVLAFEHFFRYFAESPKLAQDMMREVVFYSENDDLNRFYEGVRRTVSRIARFVAQAQADGLIAGNVAPDSVARLIFSIYRMEIRHCFASQPPDIAAGLSELRSNFDLLFNGLKARED